MLHKLYVRDNRRVGGQVWRAYGALRALRALSTHTSATRNKALFVRAFKFAAPALLACRPGLIALLTSHEHCVLVSRIGEQAERTLIRLCLHLTQPNLDFLCDLLIRKLGSSSRCILSRRYDHSGVYLYSIGLCRKRSVFICSGIATEEIYMRQLAFLCWQLSRPYMQQSNCRG